MCDNWSKETRDHVSFYRKDAVTLNHIKNTDQQVRSITIITAIGTFLLLTLLSRQIAQKGYENLIFFKETFYYSEGNFFPSK